MFHTVRASTAVALCCAVAGAALTGCDDSSGGGRALLGSPSRHGGKGLLTGTEKIKVEGRSVNVSCSGRPAKDKPVVVLMAGLGDPLTKLAGIQKTLSRKGRVCSYDRLGEGASDRPNGPQTYTSAGRILTAVLARAAGDRPVVLAGHSLGGAIAARYAPGHRDQVKGLVLMDATSPTAVADTAKLIPKSATGPAAQVRAQIVEVSEGKNPERLLAIDGKVRSAGNIPVAVIHHGKRYLAAVPHYGPGLERLWTKGQHELLAVSGRSVLSTAGKSGHYIYVDQPEVAVRAIRHVTAKAAG